MNSTADDRVPPAARVAITVATVAIVLVALHQIDTPWSELARHTAYTVLAITLPGTLVHKALRGTMGSWLADLSLGAALGLCLELGAWMIASILDVREGLWAWPLVTLALLAVPSARRRVLQRPDRPWPVLPLLGVAASTLMAFWLIFSTYATRYPLAPTGVRYYQDLLWHIGLSAEAKRAFPLGTPQVVGDGTLHYHWFSKAHRRRIPHQRHRPQHALATPVVGAGGHARHHPHGCAHPAAERLGLGRRAGSCSCGEHHRVAVLARCHRRLQQHQRVVAFTALLRAAVAGHDACPR